MATERMRLEAEMRDSASPVIVNLRKELEKLQNSTREGRAVNKLNKELEQLRKEAASFRVSPGMRELPKWLGTSTEAMGGFVTKGGGAAGVINSMGIGGLTAAASLGGLVALMKEMGDRALSMKELGRETGMTVDQVNAFAHAGQHFGVGADAMTGAINHLSGQMPEFRRNYGAMFQELSRWPDLIKKLQSEGSEDQIKDIFKFLGQAKLQNEPQLQKQILESIFGNGADMEKLFAQGAQGFLAELEKQKRNLGAISPEMLKQAQDFRDAQIKFTDSLEKFETTVGPAFLNGMTSIVSTITSAFDLLGMLNDKVHGRQSPHESDAAGAENRKNLQLQPGNPYASGKLRLLPQSFEGGSGGLLHNASFTSGGGGARLGDGADIIAAGTKIGFLAAMREMMATGDDGKGGSGGGVINASFGGGGGGFDAGAGGRGVGGSARGGDFGLGGDAAPGDGFYDAISKAEGAKNGYDTVFANGKYGTPSKPVSQMTLSEAYRFSEKIRHNPANHANAGPLGAFQMLGSTMLNHARQLGMDPNKTVFDAETQKSLARHIAKTEGLGAWEGLKIHPDMMAQARRALASGNLDGTPAANVGGKPVDIARSLAGANDSAAARSLGHYMHSGAWCADFVNGALAKAGSRGTGNAMARSFFGWGHHVGAGGAAKGDVLVKGSHVGFATGAPVMHNGQMMIPMISGNHGHRVGEGWARMNEYEVRRANGLAERSVAGANRPTASSQHQLDIHLHDRGGAVQSTSMKSNGHGLHPRLQRWPTSGTAAA